LRVPDISGAAANAVNVCMGIQRDERVLILTDEAREHIGRALAAECELTDARTLVLKIEDFVERPAKSLPETLVQAVDDFNPTCSFYAATAGDGELQRFRAPYMRHLIYEKGVRHGHMIGIDDRCMETGMLADYEAVARLTHHVTELVREARVVEVQTPSGTDLRATLDPSRRRWWPCPGIYHEPGTWGNLPEGETLTSPMSVDGVLGAEVLGDFFSERYGVLARPVRVEVGKSRVRKIEAGDDKIQRELEAYLSEYDNGDRAGEFAIGTNIALKELIGNLLQDEKIPGVHVAFGHPYPEETLADWDCPSHIDFVSTRSTIKVDGEYLMRDGAFVL
jgi:leucyl aminopeptidase (aminopeptidase T)